MKKVLCLLLLVFATAAQALGVPYELTFLQTNPAGNGFLQRYLAPLSPTPNTPGILMYDGATTLPQLGFVGAGLNWDGTTLSATGGGTVTSVAAGAGLVGGTITTSGTIALPAIGTVGTYNEVTTDTQGRVTSGVLRVFDFGFPTARSLALSTSLQAINTAKAAIITLSGSCQNVTTLLASSACTMQVRVSNAAVTCATGVVLLTVSQTIQLGLAFTTTTITPAVVNLPIGGQFILCPTAGTFTINAAEQTAG